MKDLLIIFIVLLVLLLLISSFGGSVRYNVKDTNTSSEEAKPVQKSEQFQSADKVEYTEPLLNSIIRQEAEEKIVKTQQDPENTEQNDISPYDDSDTFAAL